MSTAPSAVEVAPDGTVATEERAPSHASTRAPRMRHLLAALWMAIAAAPFVAAAVRAATRTMILGADFALSALDTSDAAHAHQLLGPYSRMGWSHPGPVWFYLLAPAFKALGGTGAAFYASYLLLQAVFAALVVAAARPATPQGLRPWAQPIAALAVICYGLRVPAIILVNPWNPFALLLPSLLLLLLAARAAAGSLPALAGVLAVGTFLIQTHVGTAPLVGGVAAVAAVSWAFTRVRQGPREWLLTAGGALLTLAAWTPPLWQQLRAAPGQGNLAQLVSYFSHPGTAEGEPHSWRQGAEVISRLLGVPVYGWPAGDQRVPVNGLPITGVLLLVAQVLGAVLLVVIGLRRSDRLAAALGGVSLTADAAALFAAHSLRGDVYDYLVMWITVLPVALAYGWLDLLLARRRSWRPALAATAVLLTLGAVVLGSRTVGLVGRLPSEPGVRQAVDMVQGHLGGRTSPVLLDIVSPQAWPTATGVAVLLEQDGFHVHVSPDWVHLFGASRAATGAEHVRIVLTDAGQLSPDEPSLGVITGELGQFAVSVVPIGPSR